jgi:hypothetical protein
MKYGQKYGLLKNEYRKVVYKGIECYEMKLNNNYSMLIDVKDIDNVKKYIWTINLRKNNSRGVVRRIIKNGKTNNQYLTRFLFEDNIDIVQFVDNNSLNFIRSNIKNSGKEFTLVSNNIVNNNKLDKKKYDIKLEKLRDDRNKIYDKDGNFKLQKVGNWHGGNDKINYIYRKVIFNNIKCIEIELNNGKTTLIDDNNDILKKVLKYKWVSNKISDTLFRAICHIDNNIIYMHRLLTDNKWQIVDHIDGNSLNNLLSNLRDGSNGLNSKNRKLLSTNTTGYNGISWDKTQERYRFRWRKNNIEHMKVFHVKTWGNKEKALATAISFKEEKDKEFGNENGIRL